MSAEKSDRLRRFDDVFRTLLVIASILISGSFAFYKGLLSSDIFFYLILAFIASIVTWAFGTLQGGQDESLTKIFSWWILMIAFLLLPTRMIFYSAYTLPKFALTAVIIFSFLLSLPMFAYFKDLAQPHDSKILKILIIIFSAFFVAVDMIFI